MSHIAASAERALSSERRVFGRRESCIHAVVHIAGRPALHCIVRNYSEGGALLELPEAVETCQPVRLVIENFGIDTVCEVRHGRGTTMGVRFYTAIEIDALLPRAGAAMAAPAPLTGTELRRKLFGPAQNVELVLVRRFVSQDGTFLRHA